MRLCRKYFKMCAVLSKNKRVFHRFFLSGILSASLFCSNDPYPSYESRQNIYYTAFSGEPKHLDPAMSYSSDEYRVLAQIYEPPLQYHLFKRPYELIPTTLTKLPQVSYQKGPKGSTKVVYTLTLRQDIRFQEHPAFSKTPDGRYAYHLNEGESFPDIDHPNELPLKSSRNLTAYDYAYQIKRLAHPKVPCPIFSILASYLDGFQEFSDLLKKEVEKERDRRKQAQGAFYNQETDEKNRPIYTDLRKYDLPAVAVPNEHTLQIFLKKRYPQLMYWLAMPFFSPVPWEVDRFYNQEAAAEQNLNLDRFPVGTGAYTLTVNRPNHRMVLERNPNFHEEFYPGLDEASPEDIQAGYLESAGQRLPFIDKVVMTLEKESIPRWNKFLQGYYDTSGLGSDFFDSVISFSESGMGLTKEMKEKKIQLSSSASQTTYYYAFNMLDDVIGGLGEKKKKLRQAVSIAFDVEEFIQIFLNQRGVPAQGPIPPEIFGYQEGREGTNPVVYEWNWEKNARERKSLALAKRLLAEAGYPGGRDSQGKPLILYYDSVQGGSTSRSEIDWVRKQFKKLDIDLQIRATNYNQFRQKVRQGNFQILRWGWHADYPDPENFLFLLYGPNGKVASGGENASNYDSPVYNQLFKQMEVMENTPLRWEIIKKMIGILREDAPWVWGFHPLEDVLYHSWYKNTKPLQIGSMNTIKYRRIDFEAREEYRSQYNDPILYPVWLSICLLFGSLYFLRRKKPSSDI